MRIALVTTTINVPEVLRLYRAAGPEVAFFVAGDKKTPEDAVNFCQYDVTNTKYLFEQDQQAWSCSPLLGWNTIGRRSIAILEALKWGAEIIVTIDDDNIPMSTDYFDRFEMVLGSPFSGFAVKGAWFDPGCLLTPPVSHRGFPHNVARNEGPVTGIINAKVGVAAGLCLGDPDISAVERIATHPFVHSVTEMGRAGVISLARTVFNSQNTALIRELAPAFLMVPQFGRFDDIFASLIAQRIMRERGLVTHFGQPFIHQQRNTHNLVSDLKAELFGMEHVTEFANAINEWTFLKSETETVIGMVRQLYERMGRDLKWMPDGVSALASAWLDDCEKVL